MAAHRRGRRRDMAVSAWLGAGAATVGIGAALVSGAALAQAQPSDSAGHSSSGKAHSGDAPAVKVSPAKTAHNGSHGHAATNQSSQAAAAAKPATAAAITPHTTAASTWAGKTKLQTQSVAPGPDAAVGQAPAAAVATQSADAASAAIEKTTRHTTTTQSSTGTTTSTTPADKSTALAALAAVSALASTPVDSESSTAAAAQTNTSWLAGKTATPGTSVTLALQEIAQAQKAVGNNFLPQLYLTVAKFALSTWQSTNPGAMAYYANNSTGLGGLIAKLALDLNESLPGVARTALQGAEFVTAAGSTSRTLIDQAAQDGWVYASVALHMYATTEPIVEISINGGPMVKVLVDTGSSGLVINSASVGTAGSLGNAIGNGTSGYSGGLTYGFNVYNTTVDFGSGIVTGLTAVDVVTPATETAYEKYISADGVVGVLGIGANAVGPGPSLVTSALPGELKDGIFINEADGVLQFGPNPRPVRASVSGSPNATGTVTVLGVSHPINLLIDSGGVYGTVPSTVWTAVGETQVPGGWPIYVYNSDGTLLYSYTTTNTNAPKVTFDAAEAQQMNTGYTPFATNPIYIAYTTTNGETDFDI